MAAYGTDYIESRVYDFYYRLVPQTPPAGLYLALFISDPGETGNLSGEVLGGSYARQPITFGAPVSGAGTETRGSNSNTVQFPLATASWGTIAFAAVCDAATGGNILSRHPLTAPKPVSINDDIRFVPGSVVITID